MPRSELDDYLKRFAGQDDVLARVDRETSERPNAMMQSRPDQGALLTLLTRMLDAREALEVGTFTGYGAICIARGLAPGGKLTCLEVDAEIAEVARAQPRARGPERSRVRSRSARRPRRWRRSRRSRTSTSSTSTPTRTATRATTRRSSRGCGPAALVVLDNTLLGGRVLEADNERGRMMTALNERIAADERVESVLLGLNDGMTLARKRA